MKKLITSRPTKTRQVLAHLMTHGNITSLEAIAIYGATRLSAIIFNLRDKGYRIVTEIVHSTDCNGNPCSYGRYHLLELGA